MALHGFKNETEVIGKHLTELVPEDIWENTQRCMAEKKRHIFEESDEIEPG